MGPFALVRRSLLALLLGCIVTVYVASGMRGVAFGEMWDEWYQAEGVEHSVKTLRLMPEAYIYSGLYFVPGYLTVAPSFLKRLPRILSEINDAPSRPFAPKEYGSIRAAQKEARELLNGRHYYENSRRIFVCISALAIFCLFAAGRALTGSRVAGLLAAALVGLSWEFSYHGRWVAIDAMLAMFTALVFACVLSALAAATAARERLLLRLGAVACGLGIGAKLPGVFLLVPLLASVAFSIHARSFGTRVARTLELGCIAGLVFVATTPGVVLDPLQFACDIMRVSSDYNRITDDNAYSVPIFRERLLAIGEYLALVAFSPYPAVAIVLAAGAAFGAVTGLLERRPQVACLVLFLFASLGFVSMQRLLIVRNLLPALAALALLAAFGLERAFHSLSRFRYAQTLVLAAGVAVSIAHASFLWRAASSVKTTSHATIAEDVLAYVDSHPGRRFHITADVLEALERVRADDRPSPASTAFNQADEVVMYASVLPGYKANQRGLARYFARKFANFDYYPGLLTWYEKDITDRPMIILPPGRARRLGFVPET